MYCTCTNLTAGPMEWSSELRQDLSHLQCSLRKQPRFAKWHLQNEWRNSILKTCHYPAADLGSASDWLKQIFLAACMTSQKHYPDLGSDPPSVWNFCTRSSDVIYCGNSGVPRNVGCFLILVLSRSKTLIRYNGVWTSELLLSRSVSYQLS